MSVRSDVHHHQALEWARMSDTLYDLRLAYEQETNRSLSMPLAGVFVWLVIAIFGYLRPENQATVVMLFGTGLI